jgi:hypothetical protein
MICQPHLIMMVICLTCKTAVSAPLMNYWCTLTNAAALCSG